MFKKIFFGLSSLVFSAASSAADSTSVELLGGFHAVANPAIATSTSAQVFTYSVRGATKLTLQTGEVVRVSIDCTGIDQVGNEQATLGVGYCVWRDEDDDKLFVSTETEGEGNVWEISGGTGKWANVSGSIATRFVYLPSPDEHIYLGIEEGRGEINGWME